MSDSTKCIENLMIILKLNSLVVQLQSSLLSMQKLRVNGWYFVLFVLLLRALTDIIKPQREKSECLAAVK